MLTEFMANSVIWVFITLGILSTVLLFYYARKAANYFGESAVGSLSFDISYGTGFLVFYFLLEIFSLLELAFVVENLVYIEIAQISCLIGSLVLYANSFRQLNEAVQNTSS